MESAWCQGRNPAGRTAKAGDMGRRSPIGWHRHGCRAAAAISQRNRLRLASHDPQRRTIDEGGSERWRGKWRCRVAVRMAWNRTERSGCTQLEAIFNTLNVQRRLILCTKRYLLRGYKNKTPFGQCISHLPRKCDSSVSHRHSAVSSMFTLCFTTNYNPLVSELRTSSQLWPICTIYTLWF